MALIDMGMMRNAGYKCITFVEADKELDYIVSTTGFIAPFVGGGYTPLNNIEQGVDSNQRVGSKVWLKRLIVKFQFEFAGENPPRFVRLVGYVYKKNKNLYSSSAAHPFTTGTTYPMLPYDVAKSPDFDIFVDEVITPEPHPIAVASGINRYSDVLEHRCYDIDLKDLPVNYKGTSGHGSAIVDNAIYFYAIANNINGTNTNTNVDYQWGYELYYSD